MGMYTEIFFRAELARDVPTDVVEALKRMMVWDYEEDHVNVPDHELFKCPRWDLLGCGGSAYYPVTVSKLFQDPYSRQWHVLFLANLKNYNGEIGKFFDWIDQYVDASQGEFLGYELYEEADTPILYHRVSEKNYLKWDEDQYEYWNYYYEENKSK